MEIYDNLKSNLETRYFKEPIKTIAFVNSNSDESNNSMVSVNYARALTKQPNSMVLLIDANLREPRLQKEFDFAVSKTISSDGSEIPLPIRVNGDNLFILPSFGNITDPLSFFKSKRFDDFLKRGRDKFDYIIIDTPSVLDLPESLVVCSKVDGVVLIIDSAKTRQKVAARIKKLLNDTGSRILGAVLDKRRYHIPAFIYKYL